MPIFNNILAGASGQGDTGYDIDQSLRLDNAGADNSANYLKRLKDSWTSDGNQKTWTISWWMKWDNEDSNSERWIYWVDGDDATSGSMGYDTIILQDEQLQYYCYVNGWSSLRAKTRLDRVFRDPGAWYHCVLSMDSTLASTNDRLKLYVNGVRETSFATDSQIGQDQTTNTNLNANTYVGTSHSKTSTQSFGGYLAEFHRIDGQALGPEYFGETNSATNQWVPIEVTGMTYGTNGFYLPFSSTELANSFSDSSTDCGDGSPCYAGDTKLLLHFDGADDGTSFPDSSRESHSITRTGTVTKTGQKKFGTASAYFDGNDGLTTSDTSDFTFGTDPFTIECWVYVTSGAAFNTPTATDAGFLFCGDSLATSTRSVEFTIYRGELRAGLYNSDSSSATYISGGTINDATWYHVALSRTASDAWAIYVDGSRVATSSTTKTLPQNANSGQIAIGARIEGGSLGQYFDGYIDDYRITKGVGRYSGASFTVPTAAFTNPTKNITANGDVANTRTTFYKTETFLSTGSTSWTCPTGVSEVEYIVVGGGGGGGSALGGGGGGGGFKTGTLSVTAGSSYTVTVGGGGASSTSGSDSVFGSITSTGGGKGASGSSSTAGTDGGSGGGGTWGGSGGSGSSGQGNDGGDGAVGAQGYGGGGGGSGSAGSNASGDNGGNGGNGTLAFDGYYYAGGGGGTSHQGGSGGSGGSGGAGGGASHNSAGSAGTNNGRNAGSGGGYSGSATGNPAGGAAGANTGSGGGGGGWSGGAGGAGGSGAVVIRYIEAKPGSSSIKFDGTGDYLDVANVDTAFGTSSDWTLEFFLRPTTVGLSAITDPRTGDSTNHPLVWIKATGVLYYYSGGADRIVGTTVLSTNTWYHVAVVRSSGTTTLYLDGQSEGSFSDSLDYASTTNFRIGQRYTGTAYNLDGYLDEIRLSDTARYTSSFTPSTTAFTADSNTLLLIHSDFNGGLGADNSGNTNDFTPTNLVATDQVLDSPTNNFCTFNPLNGDSDIVGVLAEGNLRVGDGAGAGASGYNLFSTFAVSSGKWYYEYRDTSPATRNSGVGWVDVNMPRDGNGSGAMTVTGSFWYNDQAYRNGMTAAQGSMGATLDTNVIAGVALDADAGKIWFSHNGTWFDSQDPANGTNPKSTASSNPDTWMPMFQDGNDGSGTINYGQDSSFAGAVTAQGNTDGNGKGDFYYTPPTGFKALCSDNLPDPGIADPTAYFNTVLYTGNASARSITGVGFQPDFAWFKARSAARVNALVDSVRGTDNSLQSDSTAAEYSNGIVSSFDSDGYTFAGNVTNTGFNENSTTYVAWNWKAGGTASTNTDGTITSSVSANTTAGFSIVSYTGTGSTATVGHGLSVAPELLIVKNRTDASTAWQVGSDALTSWLYYITLSSTAAQNTSTQMWNSTAPTSSVFTVKDAGDVNTNTKNYIAYCFHGVDGYSKVGSYTGNGNADGTFIYTGFRPAFVMTKSTSSTGNWTMLDSAREPTNVASPGRLYADLSNSESDGATYDFVSNGFKCRETGGPNNSGVTYIYLAFAESPFKTSNAR